MHSATPMRFTTLLLTLAALSAPAAAQSNICSSSIIGSGCGPTLDVSFAPNGNAGNQNITVSGSGLRTSGLTIMTWGVVNTGGILLPYGGCSLHTVFVWGHNINPDPGGNYSWTRSWPSWVQGSYYIQLGTLFLDANGGFGIETSEARVAVCTL